MLKRRNKTAAEEMRKKMQEKLEGKKEYNSDPDMWSPKFPKGSGKKIVRILPNKNNEPWMLQYNTHFAKIKGKYYVEPCHKSIGKDCPLCDSNKELYSTMLERYGKEVGKEKYKKQCKEEQRWAKETMLMNVLIIKDQDEPDNEGKVFKYRANKPIQAVIAKALAGDDDIGVEPLDYDCVFDGANLVIVARKNSGDFLNFDDSQFAKPSPLCGGDEKEIANVLSQIHDLSYAHEEKHYGSYDDCKAKLDKILNGSRPSASAEDRASKPARKTLSQSNDVDDDDSVPFDTSDNEAKTNKKIEVDDLTNDDDLDKLLEGID